MIRLERQCAKLADSLFVISESLRDIAINWGVDPDKIEIVPNGVSKLPQKSDLSPMLSSVTLNLWR